MKSWLVGCALVVSCVAFGYDPGDYSTWMQLKNASGTYTGSVWCDPADQTQAAVPAEAGKCYYVASGKAVSSEKVNDTFVGASLAIAGTLSLAQYGITHTFNDLRLLSGGLIKYTANNTIAGKSLTIESARATPGVITTGTYSDRDGWVITAPIVGATGTGFKIGNDSLTKARDSIYEQYGVRAVHYEGYVRINGSLAGYSGNLTVTPGTHMSFGAAVTSFPGSLTLSTNVYFESALKTGELTLGELNLEGGSELLFNRTKSASMTYVVTNRLTVTGSPEVGFGSLTSDGKFTFISPVFPEGDHTDIIRLTGEAAKTENLPDVSGIRLDMRIMRSPALRNAKCELVDGDNGDKIVRISWDPVHRMVVDNGYNDGENAFVNDSYWDPTGVPDKDLACDAVLDASLHFRAYGTVSFTNLTITTVTKTICNDAYSAYIKELHVVGVAQFQAAHAGNGQEHKFYAPIIVHDCRLKFGGWGSRWDAIHGPIRGTGSFTAYHNDTLGVRLAGDNSEFGGDILLSGPEARVDTRPTYYFGLSNKNALGGPYTGITGWKAVSISTCPWFVVNCDLDVTEPTRGLYLSGQPTFEIEKDKTMTVTEATTYSGEVTKRGAGALVLGNAAPKFESAAKQVDTPTEGANVLKIAAGTLEVAAVDAVNGLAVSFSPEASLVVNVGATGDLKTYGARNVKWETPFAAEAAIPVAFTGEMSADSDTFAICTISETAAAPTFTVPAKYAHRKVTALGWRTNGDGSQTYEVALEKQGFMLLFR